VRGIKKIKADAPSLPMGSHRVHYTLIEGKGIQEKRGGAGNALYGKILEEEIEGANRKG